MIRFLCIPIALFILTLKSFTQISPHKDYPELFHDVQMARVFSDSKTFNDCTPLLPLQKIDSCYKVEKQTCGFNLNDYVETYFLLPEQSFSKFISDTGISISEHINNVWPELLFKSGSTKGNSLIPLPNPYIVPGGRFKEMYYWDSYFTMLGLAKSGKVNLVENMVNNFAWMIDTFGFIPNGNRTYYTSRSQPPYFSLMVQLLAKHKGEVIYSKYLPFLLKEYEFWMNGNTILSDSINTAYRVVLLPDGTLLNRYYDNVAEPRPEAYFEDIELARKSPSPDSVDFRNIRAACESGWDFSSRWLSDRNNLETIETTNILPVDLNCLLYNLELTISNIYSLNKNNEQSEIFLELANSRKKAINKYFWNKEDDFYSDFNFIRNEQNRADNLAGMYPLFFKIASKSHAKNSAKFLDEKFLKDGGLTTSLLNTGQQWDAPNGWAPLQYISIIGLGKYEFNNLAIEIKQRWINTANKTYKETGKLLEKYNVENTELKGGGGEYPNQDGFGWTNGVLLELLGPEE